LSRRDAGQWMMMRAIIGQASLLYQAIIRTVAMATVRATTQLQVTD
jgi:hypothetical protein